MPYSHWLKVLQFIVHHTFRINRLLSIRGDDIIMPDLKVPIARKIKEAQCRLSKQAPGPRC